MSLFCLYGTPFYATFHISAKHYRDDIHILWFLSSLMLSKRIIKSEVAYATFAVSLSITKRFFCCIMPVDRCIPKNKCLFVEDPFMRYPPILNIKQSILTGKCQEFRKSVDCQCLGLSYRHGFPGRQEFLPIHIAIPVIYKNIRKTGFFHGEI